MLTNIFSNSTQSAKSELLSFSERKSVAFKSLIQYFVSEVSFNAIFIFETKSSLLCACSASATLAPMLVPLRSICLQRTYSFFVSVKYLYKLTIRTAKSKLFVSIMLSISITFNFPFSIINFLLFHCSSSLNGAGKCHFIGKFKMTANGYTVGKTGALYAKGF